MSSKSKAVRNGGAKAAPVASSLDTSNNGKKTLNAWSKPLQSRPAAAPIPATAPVTLTRPPPGLTTTATTTAATSNATAATSEQTLRSKTNSGNSSVSSATGSTTSSANSHSVKPPPTTGALDTKQKSLPVPSQESIALRERYLHTILQAVGQSVIVTLASSSTTNNNTTSKVFTKLEGVLHTATPFSNLPQHQSHKYVLKAIRVLSRNHGSNITYKQGETVVLDMSQVVSLQVKSLALNHQSSAAANVSVASAGFTDAEIAAKNASRASGLAPLSTKPRELQQAGSVWTTPRKGANLSQTLETSSGGPSTGANATSTVLKGSIGRWDQFQANEQLFQVKGTFDESIYTTTLDTKTLRPDQIRQAEALAKEIESSSSTNIHVAEERGHAVEHDFDEEDRFSGVLKTKMNYAAAAAKSAGAVPSLSVSALTSDEALSVTETPQISDDDAKKVETTEKPDLVNKEVIEQKNEETTTSTVETNPQLEPVEDGSLIEAELNEKVLNDETVNKTEEMIEKKDDECSRRSSKLNANAKEFTLNVNAKSFTPGGTFLAPIPIDPSPPVIHQQPYGAIDAASGMPVGIDANASSQYMQHGMMGQPGMMMMYPQYHGMRYPGYHPAMEPQMSLLPGQTPSQKSLPTYQVAQSLPPNPPLLPLPAASGSDPTSAAPSPMTTSEDGSLPPPHEGEPSLIGQAVVPGPQQPQMSIQHPPPHQQMHPMHYMPPGGYYVTGQMQMHPQHRMQGGYQSPSFMPIPTPMYRQNYPIPGAPPQNMMRPNYYQSPGAAPMQYPYGGYEDDGSYRGGRGRLRGGNNTGRNNRTGRNRQHGARGANGGRFYQQSNNTNNQSGRQTPQTPTQEDSVGSLQGNDTTNQTLPNDLVVNVTPDTSMAARESSSLAENVSERQ